MTKVKQRLRPVWHETQTVIDGRPLCVAERPTCVMLRLKGTRQTLMLPWSVAFIKAATIRATEIARAKANRRTTSVKRGGL